MSMHMQGISSRHTRLNIYQVKLNIYQVNSYLNLEILQENTQSERKTNRDFYSAGYRENPVTFQGNY